MKKITRRELLLSLGAAGAATLMGSCSFDSRSNSKQTTPSCILSPEQTQGPFYFNVDQVRKDITENKPGTLLHLVLTVVSASNCKPIQDAIVDIWHADAEGMYSGYTVQGINFDTDTTGQTFLRGIQVTNVKGKVEFSTIYPGWYPGRVPHIHFKVYLDNKNYVTSQLYFPTKISKHVYKNDLPYKERGIGNLDDSKDVVVKRYGGVDKLRMNVEKEGKGYLATHTIGVIV